ncbi:MAG: aldo/keto reductase, partial [Planctomycetota bacterium]
LDLYFAHRDDGATPLEETLAAFDTLIREGKVRYIGASNFSAWRVSEARCFSAANGWEAYCCLQQRYSYLRPKPGAMFSAPAPMGAEHEELCRVRQIPVLAYSALIKGGYTRQDKDLRHQYVWADSDARLRALRGVAAEVEGATINKIVMAWLMRRSFPCIPLIGCSNPGQLAENLGALEVELSDEQVRRMDEAGV